MPQKQCPYCGRLGVRVAERELNAEYAQPHAGERGCCAHISCKSKKEAQRIGGRYYDRPLHKWVCISCDSPSHHSPFVAGESYEFPDGTIVPSTVARRLDQLKRYFRAHADILHAGYMACSSVTEEDWTYVVTHVDITGDVDWLQTILRSLHQVARVAK